MTAGERKAELGHRLAGVVGAASVRAGSAGFDFVVAPATAAEISELVRLAQAAGAGLVVIGAGTRPPELPATPTVLGLSMARMTQILKLDETSLLVHAQAGLTGGSLEELLHRRGLTLGELPPAAMRSTLGGLLSVRTPGKSSAHGGTLEDAVVALSAVLPDGKIIHTLVVPRRAAGPDPARALLGAEGRLGIIANAVLRVYRRPEARLLAGWALPSLSAGIEVVRHALRQDVRPAAVRVTTDGASLGTAGPVLVGAFVGPAALAQIERRIVAELAATAGASELAPEVAERWWRQRTGQETAGAPPELQLWAPSGQLLAVSRWLEGSGLARLHVSRIDRDGGSLFIALGTATRDAIVAGARAQGALPAGQSNPALAPYLDAMRAALSGRGA
jgi:FAD/FMN-containing dehydrogenase